MLVEFGSLLALLTFVAFLASSIWYCVEQFRDGYHVRSIILGLFTFVLSGVPCAPFVHGDMAFDDHSCRLVVFHRGLHAPSQSSQAHDYRFCRRGRVVPSLSGVLPYRFRFALVSH